MYEKTYKLDQLSEQFKVIQEDLMIKINRLNAEKESFKTRNDLLNSELKNLRDISDKCQCKFTRSNQETMDLKIGLEKIYERNSTILNEEKIKEVVNEVVISSTIKINTDRKSNYSRQSSSDHKDLNDSINNDNNRETKENTKKNLNIELDQNQINIQNKIPLLIPKQNSKSKHVKINDKINKKEQQEYDLKSEKSKSNSVMSVTSEDLIRKNTVSNNNYNDDNYNSGGTNIDQYEFNYEDAEIEQEPNNNANLSSLLKRELFQENENNYKSNKSDLSENKLNKETRNNLSNYMDYSKLKQENIDIISKEKNMTNSNIFYNSFMSNIDNKKMNDYEKEGDYSAIEDDLLNRYKNDNSFSNNNQDNQDNVVNEYNEDFYNSTLSKFQNNTGKEMQMPFKTKKSIFSTINNGETNDLMFKSLLDNNNTLRVISNQISSSYNNENDELLFNSMLNSNSENELYKSIMIDKNQVFNDKFESKINVNFDDIQMQTNIEDESYKSDIYCPKI